MKIQNFKYKKQKKKLPFTLQLLHPKGKWKDLSSQTKREFPISKASNHFIITTTSSPSSIRHHNKNKKMDPISILSSIKTVVDAIMQWKNDHEKMVATLADVFSNVQLVQIAIIGITFLSLSFSFSFFLSPSYLSLLSSNNLSPTQDWIQRRTTTCIHLYVRCSHAWTMLSRSLRLIPSQRWRSSLVSFSQLMYV